MPFLSLVMFIEYIKSWIYENELKKEVRYETSDKALIGVILDYTNHKEESERITRLLTQQGNASEKIKFISFQPVKGKSSEPETVFTKDDVHWTGYPKAGLAMDFVSKKYKAFYYLASDLDKTMAFILTKIKADFRAGKYAKGIEQYLDLTVDTKNDSASTILKEIMETISKLKEKK